MRLMTNIKTNWNWNDCVFGHAFDLFKTQSWNIFAETDWSTAADSVSFKEAKFHTKCSSLSKIKVGLLFFITRCSILLLWMNTYPAPPRFICLALLSWESASLMSSLVPLLLAKLDFKKSSIYESAWTGNLETSKLGSAVK